MMKNGKQGWKLKLGLVS